MTVDDCLTIELPTLVLDVNEAAKVLRSGRSTIYKLIESGDLASIKIGRRRLVTYASCEDLVVRLASGETIEGAN